MLIFLNKYFALYKMLLKSFVRGFQGPFFAFIFPVISLFIIGSIVSSFPVPDGDKTQKILAFLNVAPGTIALVIVSLGISSFPQIILRYKETIIIKRLGVTPFTKTNFFASCIFFIFSISLISTLWIWGLYHAFFPNMILLSHDYITSNGGNYGAASTFTFIIGWILLVFLAISIGLWISAVAKNQTVGMGISMLLFFPSMFLSGTQIPMILVQQSKALQYISFIILPRYPIQWLLAGWFGCSGFEHNNQIIKNAFNYSGALNIDCWAAAVVSLSVSIGFLTLTTRSWKWDS